MIVALIVLLTITVLMQACRMSYLLGERKARNDCKDFPYKCWTYDGPHDTSGCGVVSVIDSKDTK